MCSPALPPSSPVPHLPLTCPHLSTRRTSHRRACSHFVRGQGLPPRQRRRGVGVTSRLRPIPTRQLVRTLSGSPHLPTSPRISPHLPTSQHTHTHVLSPRRIRASRVCRRPSLLAHLMAPALSPSESPLGSPTASPMQLRPPPITPSEQAAAGWSDRPPPPASLTALWAAMGASRAPRWAARASSEVGRRCRHRPPSRPTAPRATPTTCPSHRLYRSLPGSRRYPHASHPPAAQDSRALPRAVPSLAQGLSSRASSAADVRSSSTSNPPQHACSRWPSNDSSPTPPSSTRPRPRRPRASLSRIHAHASRPFFR